MNIYVRFALTVLFLATCAAFWWIISVYSPPPANGEPGDPPYAQIYEFLRCFAGPDGGIHRDEAIWCTPYDWDRDLDVDLWDFSQLQNWVGG
jgi:hypothetical protein